jgi:hypothetical protein
VDLPGAASEESVLTGVSPASLPPVGDRLWLRALIDLSHNLSSQGATVTDSPRRQSSERRSERRAQVDEHKALALSVFLKGLGASAADAARLPVALLAIFNVLDQLKAVYALCETNSSMAESIATDDWRSAVYGAWWFLCSLLQPPTRSRWASQSSSTLPDRVALQHIQYIMLMLSVEYLLLSADRDDGNFLLTTRFVLHLLDWLDAVGNRVLVRWLHPLTYRCVHLLLHHLIRDTLECIQRVRVSETLDEGDGPLSDIYLAPARSEGRAADFLGLDPTEESDRKQPRGKSSASSYHGRNAERLIESSNDSAIRSWLPFWPFTAAPSSSGEERLQTASPCRSGKDCPAVDGMEKQPNRTASPATSATYLDTVGASHSGSVSEVEGHSRLPADHLTRRTILSMIVLLALLSFSSDETEERELPRWQGPGGRQPFRTALAAALEQSHNEASADVSKDWRQHHPVANGSMLDASLAHGRHHSHPISLSKLHDVVVWWLHYPEGAHLLYFLTHDSARHWRRYLVARTDPETLLLPLLHRIYLGTTDVPGELLLSTLLMLVEDDGWCLALASHPLEHPLLWYREAQLVPGRFTLADVAICVLVRWIRRNRKHHPSVCVALATLSGLAPVAAAATSRPNPLDSHVGTRLFQLFEHFWRLWQRHHEAYDAAARTWLLCSLGSVLELLFAVWVAADFEPRQCGVLGDALINAAPCLLEAIRLTGRTCTPMERFFSSLVEIIAAADGHCFASDRTERSSEAQDIRQTNAATARLSSATLPLIGGSPAATPESLRDAIGGWARCWRRQQSRGTRRLVYHFEEQPNACHARIWPNIWALIAYRTGWPSS